MAVESINLLDIDERWSRSLPDSVLVLLVLGDDRRMVPIGGECLRSVVHDRAEVVGQAHSIDLEVAPFCKVALRTASDVFVGKCDELVSIVAGLLVPKAYRRYAGPSGKKNLPRAWPTS